MAHRMPTFAHRGWRHDCTGHAPLPAAHRRYHRAGGPDGVDVPDAAGDGRTDGHVVPHNPSGFSPAGTAVTGCPSEALGGPRNGLQLPDRCFVVAEKLTAWWPLRTRWRPQE